MARLWNGFGWVSPLRDTMALPPDVDGVFTVAPGIEQGDIPFHVVETPAKVALIDPPHEGAALELERSDAVSEMLRTAGMDTVVWVEREAPGAAIARCDSAEINPFDDAARGLWVLKACAGWDESPVMSLRFHRVAANGNDIHDAWYAVRASPRASLWHVELSPVGPPRLQPLRDAVADNAASSVVLLDVDSMRFFKDAYGRIAADFMLARLHAAIEAIADEENLKVFRVGSDVFALVLERSTQDQAAHFAERVRAHVWAMKIPFEYPEMKTSGRVTITAAVLRANSLRGLDERALGRSLVGSMYQAKQEGRNSVWC